MYAYEDQSSVMYHINFTVSIAFLSSKNTALHLKEQPNTSHELEAMNA
jgi:hypothetical protein